MNSAYPARLLSDLADRIDYGLTASATDTPVGPKFLRITDIVPEQLDWSTVPFCKVASDEERRKYALMPNDIVIARTGATVGYSKCINHDADVVFASYLVRVRVNSECDPMYVGYVVGSEDYKEFIRANAGGAAQPNANARVLTSYAVPLPPLSTQHKIVAILSAYDNLIENNNRRIRLLEEMAQRIYREWFVDFRYPGHEDVPLVDTELGPIPAGWKVGILDDLVVLQRGFDLPKSQRGVGTVPVIAATGRHGTHSEAKVNGPGVVTGRSGSLGAVEYIAEEFWPLNTTLWVKDFRRATPESAYFLLRNLDLAGFNSGSAVPTLNRNDISQLAQTLPPDALVARFSEHARNILANVRVLERSNEVLRATRDLLLPRVISGEVDVTDLNMAMPKAGP